MAKKKGVFMKNLFILLLLPLFCHAGIVVELYDIDNSNQSALFQNLEKRGSKYRSNFSFVVHSDSFSDTSYTIEVPKLNFNGDRLYLGKTIVSRLTKVYGGWSVNAIPFEQWVVIYGDSVEEDTTFINYSRIDMGEEPAVADSRANLLDFLSK